MSNKKNKSSGGKLMAFGLISFLLASMFISTNSAQAATWPAQVINLTNWKLTLPTGASESPTEIKQPALATYSNPPYFQINSAGNGVVFRAPVNGVTTSGSGYPRSELREMKNDGKDLASWSTTSGTHTMFIDQAVTSVPKTKKHIVAGQIHGSSDDVVVIRLEYPKLFIDINGKDGPTLDPNYVLGKRFTVKFVAANGQIKIYYNGSATPAYTLSKSSSGNYFKAGAYTQSNTSYESDDSSSNYGEVVIYNLVLDDQTTIPPTTTEPPTTVNPPVNGLAFEAESGIITSPMHIVSSSSASGGKYIVQTNDSGTGSAKYNVAIPATGQYKLQASVISPNGSSNSFYYAFDSNSSQTWNFPDNTSNWTWTDGPTVTLSQGTHTLTIKKRETNTRLDAVKLTPVTAPLSISSVDGTTPFEAESGSNNGMQIMSDDPTVSGSKYVKAGSGGYITYKISIAQAGTYRVAGWIKAADGSSDSFYVSMDSGGNYTWTLKYPTTSWTYDTNDTSTFNLSAGEHTLTLRCREAGAKIDKLVLVRQ